MIIFYNRDTGYIEGTVDGRIHTPEHLNMQIGDPVTTERLVINWIPVRWYDAEGNEITKEIADEQLRQNLAVHADFEADHEQKELFEDFERKSNDPQSKSILDYRVNPSTRLLVKKEK